MSKTEKKINQINFVVPAILHHPSISSDRRGIWDVIPLTSKQKLANTFTVAQT